MTFVYKICGQGGGDGLILRKKVISAISKGDRKWADLKEIQCREDS